MRCLGKKVDLEKELIGAFSMMKCTKELVPEDGRESYKNEMRMSNHTNFGLKSLNPAALFFDFIILFSSWLYSALIILIFLGSLSAVNLSMLSSSSNFFVASPLAVLLRYVPLAAFRKIRTFDTLQKCAKQRPYFAYDTFFKR
jgi:hypothetical protein